MNTFKTIHIGLILDLQITKLPLQNSAPSPEEEKKKEKPDPPFVRLPLSVSLSKKSSIPSSPREPRDLNASTSSSSKSPPTKTKSIRPILSPNVTRKLSFSSSHSDSGGSHIESSSVTTDKSGYLYLKGGIFRKWKKYWFVQHDMTLSYYKTKYLSFKTKKWGRLISFVVDLDLQLVLYY
jgi:hypothetical protein